MYHTTKRDNWQAFFPGHSWHTNSFPMLSCIPLCSGSEMNIIRACYQVVQANLSCDRLWVTRWKEQVALWKRELHQWLAISFTERNVDRMLQVFVKEIKVALWEISFVCSANVTLTRVQLLMRSLPPYTESHSQLFHRTNTPQYHHNYQSLLCLSLFKCIVS